MLSGGKLLAVKAVILTVEGLMRRFPRSPQEVVNPGSDVPALVAPAQLNLIFGGSTFDYAALFFLIMTRCHIPPPEIELAEIICELGSASKFVSRAGVCPGSLS